MQESSSFITALESLISMRSSGQVSMQELQAVQAPLSIEIAMFVPPSAALS
jgi:hypothetical protein